VTGSWLDPPVEPVPGDEVPLSALLRVVATSGRKDPLGVTSTIG
jgi:hypothetical protein